MNIIKTLEQTHNSQKNRKDADTIIKKHKKIPPKVVLIDEATGRPYVIDHQTGKKISPAGWELRYGCVNREKGEILDMDAVIYGLYRDVVL